MEEDDDGLLLRFEDDDDDDDDAADKDFISCDKDAWRIGIYLLDRG